MANWWEARVCKYITLTSEGTPRSPERHVPEIPPQGDFCPREKGVSALAGFFDSGLCRSYRAGVLATTHTRASV